MVWLDAMVIGIKLDWHAEGKFLCFLFLFYNKIFTILTTITINTEWINRGIINGKNILKLIHDDKDFEDTIGFTD